MTSKLFVNRLATLHMQWPCEEWAPAASAAGEKRHDGNIESIPLILQAAFALREGRVGADLSARLFPSPAGAGLFHDSELRLIGVDKWKRHVAAMWYGVPQEEAFHMLLRPRLVDSLGMGVVRDGGDLRKMPYEEVQESGMLDAHGFWKVVPAVAREFIGPSDGRTLERSAKVLAVLARWRDEKQPWHAEWKTAWEATTQDATLALQDGRAGVHHEGVWWSGENFALALKVPEASPELAHAALGALGRMEHAPSDEDYAKWAKQTVAIMSAMVAKGTPQWAEPVESFRVPRPEQHPVLPLIFLLGAAYERSALTGRPLGWADGHDEAVLIESMRKAFSEAKLQVPANLALLYHARAFHWLASVRPDGPWGPVIELFPEWFGEGKFVPSVLIPLARGFLSILKGLNKNQTWFGVMCGKKGHFQNAISRIQDFARTTTDQGEKANAPEAVKVLGDILNFLSGSTAEAAN